MITNPELQLMRLMESLNFSPQSTAQHAPPVRALTIFSLLCVSLGLIRTLATGKSMLMWLDWNLLLAWMPLFFALAFRHTLGTPETSTAANRTRLLTALAFGWLLFLPNAPYLVTDFVHFKPRDPVPVWFDILLFMSFAWTGLALGFLSLRLLQKEVACRWGRWSARWFVVASLILCSFGVYIGRVGRWNSWDVVVHPLDLTDWCARSFLPGQFLETLAFCGPMFLFLLAVHSTLHCMALGTSRPV